MNHVHEYVSVYGNWNESRKVFVFVENAMPGYGGLWWIQFSSLILNISLYHSFRRANMQCSYVETYAPHMHMENFFFWWLPFNLITILFFTRHCFLDCLKFVQKKKKSTKNLLVRLCAYVCIFLNRFHISINFCSFYMKFNWHQSLLTTLSNTYTCIHTHYSYMCYL